MLLREIKEDPNKQRYRIYSWIRNLNVLKPLIFPKFTYKINAIPVKISEGFLLELFRLI